MNYGNRVSQAIRGLVLLCWLAAGTALANERAFTLVYEAKTMPKGSWEYEQWVTWKGHKESDGDFDRFDIRHEIEYGVTDRFNLALYYDWRYQDGESVDPNKVSFRDIAVEAVYQLTDPVNDPIGSALYLETKVGDNDELFVLEAKLLLSKDIGRWTFAWNGILEAEWEGQGYQEDKAVFGETAGVSFELHPRLRVGVEALHEIERAGWAEWGEHVVYVGPNLSYRSKGWWATLTPTFQTTDREDEPDYLTRLIVGFDF